MIIIDLIVAILIALAIEVVGLAAMVVLIFAVIAFGDVMDRLFR